MKPLGKCIDIIRDWENRDSFDKSDVRRTLTDLFKTEPELRSGIADLLDKMVDKGIVSKTEIIYRPFGKSN